VRARHEDVRPPGPAPRLTRSPVTPRTRHDPATPVPAGRAPRPPPGCPTPEPASRTRVTSAVGHPGAPPRGPPADRRHRDPGPPRRVRPHRRTPPPRRPPPRAAAGDRPPRTRPGRPPPAAPPTPTPAASRPPRAGPADGRPFAEVDLAIEGMTCASCVARVEKRLNRVDGATATVNLPLESAHVVLAADVSDADLVAAVEKAGYTARVTTRRTPVDH